MPAALHLIPCAWRAGCGQYDLLAASLRGGGVRVLQIAPHQGRVQVLLPTLRGAQAILQIILLRLAGIKAPTVIIKFRIRVTVVPLQFKQCHSISD